jgi:hypothetical protein
LRSCPTIVGPSQVRSAWGTELCLPIVGLSQVRSHLLVRMRAAVLHHTEMVRELAVLHVVVSSAAVLALGCLPDETCQVEVMNELAAKF